MPDESDDESAVVPPSDEDPELPPVDPDEVPLDVGTPDDEPDELPEPPVETPEDELPEPPDEELPEELPDTLPSGAPVVPPLELHWQRIKQIAATASARPEWRIDRLISVASVCGRIRSAKNDSKRIEKARRESRLDFLVPRPPDPSISCETPLAMVGGYN